MKGDSLAIRTSRLTWLYVAALTSVALLSLTGQLLVQRSLHRQSGDSTVVNIAGRQRMLSQRLTKAVLAWNQAPSAAEQVVWAAEIRETLALWKSSHAGLQRGDAALQLAPHTSAVVAAQFAELEPIFQEMVAAVTQFTSAPEGDRPQLLAQLLRAEPKFLSGMDAIVFQLDREAQARVATLQRIEWVLLSLTLLVLAIEGWFVFRPAVQSVRVAAAVLVESEEQLRLAKEAAESASEQKTRFLATLSHELRNPLHAILGNLELVTDTALTKAQREHLSTVDNSARSLLGLVNDLLDLACIQAGQLRVTAAACDLGALSQRCVAMMEPLAERRGLQLNLQLLDEPLTIAADPLRVQQILLNLLGNAVKFTASGWITLRVSQVNAQTVRLEVSDTGPGIPADLQQTIFAAFAQVDGSTRREHAGVGLGLAISAGLVELLQGQIGVESKVGQGSRFWVELPSGDVTALATPVAEQRSRPARLRVLVAEDDAVNRRLLGDFLQVLGHDAILAEDGRVALEEFKAGAWDCVLLDWHMPQLDGLELAQAIRDWERAQALPRVPLLAISAAGAIAAEAEARVAGIDALLLKPLSLEQLRQALGALPVAPASSPPRAAAAATRFAGSLARMQGKRDLFCDVAALFLEQLPQELSQVQRLTERGQFGDLARAAHLLRGQAVNFDSVELVQATSELETGAAASDPGRCAAASRLVHAAAGELEAELRAVLGDLRKTLA